MLPGYRAGESSLKTHKLKDVFSAECSVDTHQEGFEMGTNLEYFVCTTAGVDTGRLSNPSFHAPSISIFSLGAKRIM